MPFLTVDQGVLQARISSDTGDIEFAGPDLQGKPLANSLWMALHIIRHRKLGNTFQISGRL
jgi:hypothetical protein